MAACDMSAMSIRCHTVDVDNISSLSIRCHIQSTPAIPLSPGGSSSLRDAFVVPIKSASQRPVFSSGLLLNALVAAFGRL